jgi:hypothetical protein
VTPSGYDATAEIITGELVDASAPLWGRLIFTVSWPGGWRRDKIKTAAIAAMQTTAARPAKPRAQPPSANFFPEDFGTCFAIPASNDANDRLLEIVNLQPFPLDKSTMLKQYYTSILYLFTQVFSDERHHLESPSLSCYTSIDLSEFKNDQD